MTNPPAVPTDPTRAAVSLFWTNRTNQMSALADRGLSGGVARSGGHMDGIADLVADIFRSEMARAGMNGARVISEPYLPGYYRARKRWDTAVTYRGSLVAALEFKSQVGSVGKNINNRFEEALGTGTDTWAAHQRNNAFGSIPPWLGYVLVLCEDDETEVKNRDISSLFPVDAAYRGLSYNERYQMMLSRFVQDNVYQAGWFITTKLAHDSTVGYEEPLATATGRSFRALVRGRVEFVRSVLG